MAPAPEILRYDPLAPEEESKHLFEKEVIEAAPSSRATEVESNSESFKAIFKKEEVRELILSNNE